MKHLSSRRAILFAAALLTIGGFFTLGDAKVAWSDHRQLGNQVSEFEDFMREHPKASTELQQNPDLVFNRKWLDKHPEVDHFLKGRPELRYEIARQPERVFGWNGYDGRRFDDGRFGRRDWERDRYGRGDRHWGWDHR